MVNSVDVVVIGGGAAGLMCAATAARRGRSVKVLEHANKVGKKILMSGGGRCNFTNYFITPENYLSNNPHFCKSALSRYTAYNFIALVEKYQLAHHEKTQGQLFCDHKASDILEILLKECEDHGVEIFIKTSVDRLETSKVDAAGSSRFHLTTSRGDLYCQSVVIATGGLSIPTMGATGFGYGIARQFDLPVTETQAALVPFIFTDQWLNPCQQLAGVSLPVKASCGHQSFLDALLFTHRGISGPAILQLSNYWRNGDPIVIDFLPNDTVDQIIGKTREQHDKTVLKNLLGRYLPKRFVGTWLEGHRELAGTLDKTVFDIRDSELRLLEKAIHHWRVIPAGTEGYRTAEVTLGGVDTSAVSSKTFEAKNVPGLFFIGEVLDVTGWLGGFNFQWAWSSGYCAGQYV